MRELYLKPTDPDSIVRIPERGGVVMPPHGAKVIDSPFWRKRLRDESVVETTADEFEKAEKKAQAAAQAEARKAHDEASQAQKEKVKQTIKPATGTAGDK